MKIKISADSTCDLSPELIERYHIGITPLYIIRGEETLRDGIDVRPEELYEYANVTGKLCKTAAVQTCVGLSGSTSPRAREEYDAVIPLHDLEATCPPATRTPASRRRGLRTSTPWTRAASSTGIRRLVLSDAAEMARQGMDAANIASAPKT